MAYPKLMNLLTILGMVALLVPSHSSRAVSSVNPVKLAQCPDSPNCVSSREGGPRSIAPLGFKGSPESAFGCLKQIVSAMKRTTVVQSESGYLHVEFRTLLGFVDDVEFLLEREHGTIHMRSASRAGYWDLGTNRRRLESVRNAFNHQCNR